MAQRILYLIGDRRALGQDPAALDRLIQLMMDAALVGVDYLQIRERDLETRTLLDLAQRIRNVVPRGGSRLLVNDRLDVALAAELDGVHLATHSMAPRTVRKIVGMRCLIGASTHSYDEVRSAEGADFVVCGPVFDTPSKRGMGRPLGITNVRSIASRTDTPVLALGGITRENAPAVLRSPISGIAAIRLFQDAWLEGGCDALAALVESLRDSCEGGSRKSTTPADR